MSFAEDFKHTIFYLNDETFRNRSLEAFKYQYNACAIYRTYCQHLNKSPETVHSLQDIPFLPIGLSTLIVLLQPWFFYFGFRIFDCAKIPPTDATTTFHAPDDHQDDMQPPCPPQNIFSMHVLWPVSRHSEHLVPETDENRLSAHVTGRPRPPRRLQL